MRKRFKQNPNPLTFSSRALKASDNERAEERFSAVFWETGAHQRLIYSNSNSCAKLN